MTNYLFLISVVTILVLGLMAITFCKFQLNNDQYDRLKYVVIKWPAITAFLSVIVSTFKTIPYGVETVTIVAAIGVLLAEILNVSKKRFNEGAEVIKGDEPLEDGDLDE